MSAQRISMQVTFCNFVAFERGCKKLCFIAGYSLVIHGLGLPYGHIRR